MTLIVRRCRWLFLNYWYVLWWYGGVWWLVMLVVSLCRTQDEIWTCAARWHMVPTTCTAIAGSRWHGTVHDGVVMLDVMSWRWGVRCSCMRRWAMRRWGWQSGWSGGPAYCAATYWCWNWLRRNRPRKAGCGWREDWCWCGLRLKSCWKQMLHCGNKFFVVLGITFG